VALRGRAARFRGWAIADHEKIKYPRKSILHKDTGFQGVRRTTA